MREAISEIVGDAVLADKTACVAYRALRPLECSTCGAAIAEGALFTRRSLPSAELRIWPQCRRCAPLELKPVAAVEPPPEQRKPARSALLNSLLTTKDGISIPAPQTPRPSSPDDSTARTKRTTAEEVERRLGPALRRGRRSRM